MNQINLSDLDYTNIRTSLVNYLKKQDTVRDLNFEGSAVNFLLDLLAYNTLYYAHFANMISGEAFLDTAQLEKSIVSLVKPLGYVLPTRTSAKARIKLSNITTETNITPYSINVVGTNPEGLQYQFWNIDSIPIRFSGDSTSNDTDYFTIYEGTYNLLTYGGDGFDFPNQEILIPDLNLDLKTIRVSVKRASDPIDDPYKYWSLVDTYSGYFIESTSNLYSIERRLGGFVVKFQTSANQQLILVPGDKVKIEYLSSNGSSGNNSSSFRGVSIPFGSLVINLTPSSGGLDSPNLNDARKIAPLIFSSQQRLVTKSDYIGFLAQLGYSDVNIWGGEDNTPPIYGRLLFSINGIQTTNNSEIKNIITKMKERSIVTVLPEYVPPASMAASFSLRTSYDPNIIENDPFIVLNSITQKIESNFPVGSFNKSLTTSFISSIVESYDGMNFLGISDVKLQYDLIPISSVTKINFKNPIKKVMNTNGGGVESTPFTSSLYETEKVIIRDTPIRFPNPDLEKTSIGKLKLFTINDDGQETEIQNLTVGEVNYSLGIVTIYPEVSNTELFTLSAFPRNASEILAKDEVYLKLEIAKVQPEIET